MPRKARHVRARMANLPSNSRSSGNSSDGRGGNDVHDESVDSGGNGNSSSSRQSNNPSPRRVSFAPDTPNITIGSPSLSPVRPSSGRSTSSGQSSRQSSASAITPSPSTLYGDSSTSIRDSSGDSGDSNLNVSRSFESFEGESNSANDHVREVNDQPRVRLARPRPLRSTSWALTSPTSSLPELDCGCDRRTLPSPPPPPPPRP